MKWQIIKRYGHEQGLSCVFKQWRAPETHCSKLHGYALAIEVCFEGDDLDDRNWLISFGDLKPFKKYLEDTFDHKLCAAVSDPDLSMLMDMEEAGICQLTFVEEVGCEYFAKMIYDWLDDNIVDLAPKNMDNVRVKYVEVQEHAGNTARYEPEDIDAKYRIHEQIQQMIDEEKEPVEMSGRSEENTDYLKRKMATESNDGRVTTEEQPVNPVDLLDVFNIDSFFASFPGYINGKWSS